MKSLKTILAFIGAFFIIAVGVLVVIFKLIIIIPLVIIFFILALFGLKFKSFKRTFTNFNVNKKNKTKNKNTENKYKTNKKNIDNTIDVDYKIKE